MENCPLCGKKMEKGYVSTQNAIDWGKKKTSSWNRKGEEILVGTIWSGTCVEGYRCLNCEIVLFHYGKTS